MQKTKAANGVGAGGQKFCGDTRQCVLASQPSSVACNAGLCPQTEWLYFSSYLRTFFEQGVPNSRRVKASSPIDRLQRSSSSPSKLVERLNEERLGSQNTTRDQQPRPGLQCHKRHGWLELCHLAHGPLARLPLAASGPRGEHWYI